MNAFEILLIMALLFVTSEMIRRKRPSGVEIPATGLNIVCNRTPLSRIALMTPVEQTLNWLADKRDVMIERVLEWSAVNSGTDNLPGLARQAQLLERDFSALGARFERRMGPPERILNNSGEMDEVERAPVLFWKKRPEAPFQVFLAIHYDTVYPADSSFQRATWLDHQTLQGPGVADAKGGIAVLLYGLLALERHPAAAQLGWVVALNGDEEVGSPSSTPLLLEAVQGARVGFLFEPTLPDGSLVRNRKASGNFSCLIRGRPAHVGRDFQSGRSALFAAADFLHGLSALNNHPGLIANAGRVDGGGPSNVVPDLAIVRFNLRAASQADIDFAHDQLKVLIAELNARDGIQAQLEGDFSSPPKILDAAGLDLLEFVRECAREEGLELGLRDTGGACDGNRLMGAGLPNVDTLGVRGDCIHSDREILFVDSLVERARLFARILCSLADNPDRVRADRSMVAITGGSVC
ncbi:MAG: hydrolase [Spirochaetales bacterium]|nr:hydrolase [Spirochaetales bacterium]